jgi:SNF2 family DNA or RNA helicase
MNIVQEEIGVEVIHLHVAERNRLDHKVDDFEVLTDSDSDLNDDAKSVGNMSSNSDDSNDLEKVRKRFIDDRELIDECIKMNGDFVHHPTPKGFKAKLLLHQKTVLAAMLGLEDTRVVQGKTRGKHGDQKQRFETCAGLLSEKFGSGKTIMILALMAAKPMPDNKPIYQVCRANGRNKNRWASETSFFIKKRFRQDLILKPALLLVASSVMLQWAKAVNDFTTFKVMSIASVYDLRKLQKCIRNNTVNEYDIVLVKNGNITGEFTIDGYTEDKNKKKQRKIYNIIANISRGHCWSRVVLDDYDIIKLPCPTSFMNGLFTWFISATDFRININAGESVEHSKLHDILTYHNIDLQAMTTATHLKKTLNICNEGKYTEDSISVGKPVFWAHILVNKNKQYVQMIGAMEGDKANEIMEMLNGDAIRTAAEHAGIKSDSIMDIFKKILQNQYDKYTLSVATLGWIETLDIDGFVDLDDPDEDDVYHQKHVYEKRPIKYKYPDIKGKVVAVLKACEVSKAESGKAIERVKDNIKEGDCPVCCCDLNDNDAIIVRCCGKILCADCGIQGTNLVRYGNSIEGKCPNCRAIIGFTDLIFLEEGFDLEDIVTEEKEEEPREITEDVKKIVEEKENTKFDILRKIILGENLPNKQEKNVTIKGMLEGIKELPEAPKKHRKTIIFSKFDESLNDMEKKIKENKISYKRLGGTSSQIHAVATEFQDSYDGVNVLIINGEKYASGLNLQSATDLVFMHKIMDRNIESQIIGRIQRLGRIYKAHVHYILYEDEIKYMNFT